MNLRLLALTFIVCRFNLSVGSADAEGKIHVVLAGDTANVDRDLRKSIHASQTEIFSLFRFEFPQSSVLIYQPEDGQIISGAWLRATIQNISADPDDCVFVYYIGHGSYDVNSKQHKLLFTNEPLSRTEVETDLMGLKEVRLRCLVTDSCAVAEPAASVAAAHIGPTEIPAGLRRLFLDSKGFLNVNSCDWGQMALANYMSGGHLMYGGPFTLHLSGIINEEKNSSSISWMQVHQEASRRTRVSFSEMVPDGRQMLSLGGESRLQKTQDPIFLAAIPDLNSPSGSTQSYVMGVQVRLPEAGQGVEIIDVSADSPATRMRKRGAPLDQIWSLEKSDTVLQLGGRATDSVSDLLHALVLNTAETWLKVRDGATGEVFDYEITLEPSN